MIDLKIYFLLDFNEAKSKSYLPFDHIFFNIYMILTIFILPNNKKLSQSINKKE